MSDEHEAEREAEASQLPERQRVERAPGRARRARLTPAPGSDPSPEAPVEREAPRTGQDGASPARRPSPDDERLTRDRPPHWRRD